MCEQLTCIFIPDVVYCQQKEMGAQYVKIMDTRAKNRTKMR